MGRLLQLLTRNGGFMTLLLVELFSFYLIIQNNDEQDAIFTHTMGVVGGNMLEKRREWSDYANLEAISDSLIAENARLHSELADARHIQVPYRDTFFMKDKDSLLLSDSSRRALMRPQYKFIAAQVVGNTISSANNWLMINRGSLDGVRPHMGVVSRDGVVGIVRHVSPHFSVAMSVLHRQTKVTVAVERFNALGSLVWEGGDPSIMSLQDVMRHFRVKDKDAIVTSGYSQIFPKGVVVGHVDGDPEPDPENRHFWNIKVKLTQDMASVNNVYVVENIYYTELDSLMQQVKNEQ
ncbi:MAG: rod shape-determining protein MreC [Saprospiraceae bacterium]